MKSFNEIDDFSDWGEEEEWTLEKAINEFVTAILFIVSLILIVVLACAYKLYVG